MNELLRIFSLLCSLVFICSTGTRDERNIMRMVSAVFCVVERGSKGRINFAYDIIKPINLMPFRSKCMPK